MNVYQTKTRKLSGSSYSEIEKQARKIHNGIAHRTKRSPYVRSIYFKKEKYLSVRFGVISIKKQDATESVDCGIMLVQ